MHSGIGVAAVLAALLAGGPARAALIDVGPGGFVSAGTFDLTSVPLYTTNPVISLTAAGYGSITASFGSYFVGQTLTTNGLPFTLATTTPSGPLALADDPVDVAELLQDGANPDPTAPVVAGYPDFNGPVAMLLSQSVSEIGLTVGYLNDVGLAEIQVYDAAGNVIGSVVSSQTGFQTFDLQDTAGADIAGLIVYPLLLEPGGFEVSDVNIGAVPEPATWAMVLPALAALRRLRRRTERR